MTCTDITDTLDGIFDLFTLEEADEWLCTPHPLLNGRTPMGLICEGRGAEARELIKGLREKAT